MEMTCSYRHDPFVGTAHLVTQRWTVRAQQRRLLPELRQPAEPKRSTNRQLPGSWSTSWWSRYCTTSFADARQTRYNKSRYLLLNLFHQSIQSGANRWCSMNQLEKKEWWLTHFSENKKKACPTCLGPAFFYGQPVANGGVPVYAIVRQYYDAWNTIDVVYHTFYPYNRGKNVCIGQRLSFDRWRPCELTKISLNSKGFWRSRRIAWAMSRVSATTWEIGSTQHCAFK